jgi:hypothetical protein
LGTSATNTGTIQAAEAELKANGGNVYALAGNTGGIIQATGVSATDGKVLLIAEDGTTTANGTIQASGEVETSGESVNFDGLTVKAANWLVDPTDLTISGADAATLSNALGGGTSVTLETTSTTPSETGVSGLGTTTNGAGDIIIASPVSWTSSAILTLNAYHSIAIDAPITTSGGGVVLNTNYNNAGGGGDYGFGLTAAGFSGSLTFTGGAASGESLTINGQAYTLLYALADGGHTAPDTGTDDIAGIDSAGDGGYYALAVDLNGTGTTFTGALAGATGNNFTGVFTGLGHTITGLTIDDTSGNGLDALFGKLVAGSIRDVGLVGGQVSGASVVADLVADQVSGSISNVYETGAISGASNVGGLVAEQFGGTIIDAYATGAVSGDGIVGGLVGFQSSGAIANAYATGVVTGTGYDIGGLVGSASGSISDVYATGAVWGAGVPFVGGLVGNQSEGNIVDAYATGAVVGYISGGLVGTSNGTITDSYYDTSTTRGGGAGSGETTAALQATLPAFENRGLWSGGAGLYPYLANFFPNGVQAVSGVAYANAGTTVAASNISGAVPVTLTVAGAAEGSASTGANGYYYFALPAGTIDTTSGSLVLASTAANAATGAANAASFTQATGSVSGLNLYGGDALYVTSALLYSTAGDAAAHTALAGYSATNPAFLSSLTPGILATGASFTLDQALDLTSSLAVYTDAAGADLTVAAPLTLEGANSLTLGAAQDLAIDAAVMVKAGGAVSLTAGDDYNFGLTAAGFRGSLSFTGAEGGGQSLTIDGSSYTLIYSMSELASQLNGRSGRFALATSLAGGSYDDAVVGEFDGTFTGLGHIIAGLTIGGFQPDAGLFGMQSTGAIRDIGIVGGLVAGVTVGALVGVSDGTITDVYATAAVTGASQAGGLVGNQQGGSISDAYATGAVSGVTGAGGLVGEEDGATISDAYATGAVSAQQGGAAGGLVGVEGGAINDAYATGAVSGAGSSTDVGGLVGDQYGGSVTDAYATGAVSGASARGLVGNPLGTVTDSYYDTSTTGQSGGAGSGVPTATLQGALPTFQNSALWATGPGLYPYLANFFPNGAQAISGIAYADAGATPLASGAGGVVSVGATAGGVSLGAASTDANGYYYILAQAGAVASGTPVLVYGNDAATLTTSAGAPNTGGVNLYGDALAGTTSATTYSSAISGLSSAMVTAANGDSAALAAISSATGAYLTATGASFTVDETIVTPGALAITTTAANAPLTVAQPITINAAGGLILDATGALAIDAPIAVNGARAVSLAAGHDYGFGLTSTGFAGSLTFASGVSDPSLTIDGRAYTLVFSLSELISDLNGSTGDFALAASMMAPGSYSAPLVSSFGGIFTGLGNTITDLTITGADNLSGLFSVEAPGGVIRDIGLAGGAISGGVGVGALAGKAEGLIEDAYSTASVTGTSDAGGLVGYLSDIGVVADATTGGGSVSATTGAGGLVGKNVGTIDAGAASADSVSGDTYVGGVAGYSTGIISNASATGAVTGSGAEQAYIGGLAGFNSGAISGASAATGAVNGLAEVGGLVGDNVATGVLSDDTASGTTVTGTSAVGGLVGKNLGTIETVSSSSDAVSGSRYVGGLAGYSTGVILGASAGGNVSGTTEAGGLVGYNSGNISSSGASGNVSGTTDLGGLAGYNGGGVTGASATGSVTGTGGQPVDLGGLVGENGAAGVITASEATGGSVTAPDGVHLGGLVGANAGQIGQSFATATVGSDGGGGYQGGLVGYNTAGAIIGNTYATGQVAAGTDIGGLVGENAGVVETSWASGPVAGGATSGGVAGANMSGGYVTNVYWDVGTTGLAAAFGHVSLGFSNNATSIGGATGRNPDLQATYKGFNFTTFWTINPGASRPYLKNVTPQAPPQ